MNLVILENEDDIIPNFEFEEEIRQEKLEHELWDHIDSLPIGEEPTDLEVDGFASRNIEF